MGREFPVEAPKVVKPIANGAYTGIITAIQYRGPNEQIKSEYDYVDFIIKVDNLPDTETTYSLPSKLRPTTAFGQFLNLFQAIKVGEKIDPEKIVIGKAVSFMIMNAPGKNDPTTFYPRVVKGSVFPKK